MNHGQPVLNPEGEIVDTIWRCGVNDPGAGFGRDKVCRQYAERVSANFKIFEQETGRRDEDPTSSRRDFSITPALQFSFKNEINSNLSVSYAKNTTNTRGSSSENTNLSVSLDFRKIFRGGAGFRIPLPFLNKRVDWSSQLETNLSLAYSQTGGKRFVTGSVFFEPIPQTTSLRISPAMTYNFTDALSGRMFIDYARQYNEATDQTITTLRLGVNAVFTF